MVAQMNQIVATLLKFTALKKRIEQREKEIRRLQRRIWRLPSTDWYSSALPHLRRELFKKDFRMDIETFEKLFKLLEPFYPERRSPRGVIPKRKRMAMALYRLATAGELRGIAKKVFGVGNSTLCCALREFVKIVNVALKDIVRVPHQFELEGISQDFERIGGFPGIVGAVDGCHIPISPPRGHAYDYFNFHGWHSINLFALVDANYLFRFASIGTPGRVHDSAIYRESKLVTQYISQGYFQGPSRIPHCPYTILGDSAFPLHQYLMKPYPNSGNLTPKQRAFNYSLSRCRRVVENTFGRLKGRFRILLKRMQTGRGDIKYNTAIVKCCVYLHNFCEMRGDVLSQGQISTTNFQSG